MAIFKVDLTELPRHLREAIRTNAVREEEVQFQLARIRQTKIAKWFHDHKPRSIDGVGEQTMAIDPFFARYLELTGVDFWGDPDVKKWLDKRHPEFRVKSGGTRTQVGYGTGFQKSEKVKSLNQLNKGAEPSASSTHLTHLTNHPFNSPKKFSKTFAPSTGAAETAAQHTKNS
jgi:hypothetical protein